MKRVYIWKLKRLEYSDKQTLGKLSVYLFNDWLFDLYTLEQEWSNNEISDSCIIPGNYIVSPANSSKHGKCFEVLNVENRTKILFHVLNYYFQSQGCIGVGLEQGDINDDGYKDLKRSSDAMNDLIEECWDCNSKILLQIS